MSMAGSKDSRAQIAFADADLAASHFDVEVDYGVGEHAGRRSRHGAARARTCSTSEKYPKAHFVTSAFTRKAAGQYEAAGQAHDPRRDARHPPAIHLPDAQEGGKPVAWLKGGVTLKRLDYGVGQGDWKDTSMVANEVRVKFELRLTPDAAAAADEPVPPKAVNVVAATATCLARRRLSHACTVPQSRRSAAFAMPHAAGVRRRRRVRRCGSASSGRAHRAGPAAGARQARSRW